MTACTSSFHWGGGWNWGDIPPCLWTLAEMDLVHCIVVVGAVVWYGCNIVCLLGLFQPSNHVLDIALDAPLPSTFGVQGFSMDPGLWTFTIHIGHLTYAFIQSELQQFIHSDGGLNHSRLEHQGLGFLLRHTIASLSRLFVTNWRTKS